MKSHIDRRMKALEERARRKKMPLAVISTVGVAPEEAARIIVERQSELAAAGDDGVLLVLDR